MKYDRIINIATIVILFAWWILVIYDGDLHLAIAIAIFLKITFSELRPFSSTKYWRIVVEGTNAQNQTVKANLFVKSDRKTSYFEIKDYCAKQVNTIPDNTIILNMQELNEIDYHSLTKDLPVHND